MRLSIRARLTALYTAVFIALLCFYLGAVFLFQYRQFLNQMYNDEVQEIEAVEGLLFFTGDGMLHLHESYYSHPRSRLLVDRLLEIHDDRGDLLYRNASLRNQELGRPTYPNEGEGWFERRDARLGDARDVLFASHLHPVDGRMVLIRLGYDLAPFHERMWRFLYLLLIALPPSVLLAAWSAYRLSHSTFAPLREMAAHAEQITARNLGARLGMPEPSGDELGRMACVINDLLQRLEQAFAQLQHFTADVAHELRTPLTALRSSGEQALIGTQTPSASDLTEVIGNMLEETERLTQTIDGLLLLSRAESGSSAPDRTTFTLPELVDEVVALMDVLLDERMVQVKQEQLEQGGGCIFADRSLVRSALLNVVHNAVRYSPPASEIRITYSLLNHGSHPTQQVCIEDQGPGLSAGEHEHVFERFYRGSAQTSGPSTGLGLAIAKMALEHSSGSICADADYTAGMRCCIRLPIHAGEQAGSR